MSSREHFTVDFVKKQIIGTETSLNKAKHPGNKEYKELCDLVEAHPRFRVVAKKIEHQASKQTYKKLNYDFIEKYISIQPDADKIKREYEQVKRVASSLGMSVYPRTKRWFLKKFDSFNMDEAREELINAGLAAAQVEESIIKAEESKEPQVDVVTQTEKPSMAQIEAVA